MTDQRGSNPPVINREQLIEALGGIVYEDSNSCACVGMHGDSDISDEVDAAVVAINARIAAHVRAVLKVVKGPDDDSHLTYVEWVEKHHGKDLANRARELAAAVNLDILDRMFADIPAPKTPEQPMQDCPFCSPHDRPSCKCCDGTGKLPDYRAGQTT